MPVRRRLGPIWTVSFAQRAQHVGFKCSWWGPHAHLMRHLAATASELHSRARPTEARHRICKHRRHTRTLKRDEAIALSITLSWQDMRIPNGRVMYGKHKRIRRPHAAATEHVVAATDAIAAAHGVPATHGEAAAPGMATAHGAAATHVVAAAK